MELDKDTLDLGVEIQIPDVARPEPRITVATYNLLGKRDSDHISEIADILADKCVDVVSIQGCHKHNAEALFRAFKRLGYLYTRFDQINTRLNGEIMFHKTRTSVTIKKKEYTKFSSTSQLRGICKYRVAIGSPPVELWVITSHLEEGGSGNGHRRTQILELAEQFSKSDVPVIFAGDTSIPSWQNLGVPNGWLDAWREKGNSDNEKTSELDRMDQVWYKSHPKSQLECVSYELFGPSDDSRKGVIATFEVHA